MVSASGVYRRTSIVAMALFTQYWYWFPMSYMLALSFAPTALIGVTADVKLPKFHVVCECPKGRFAYAKPVADSSKKKVLLPCHGPQTTIPNPMFIAAWLGLMHWSPFTCDMLLS